MRRRDSLATVRAARRLDPAWFTRSLAAFSADHAEQSGLERGRQGLGGRSRTVVCCADVQVGHPADPVRLVHQLGLPPPEALRAAAAWSGDGNPTGQKAHPCLRSECLQLHRVAEAADLEQRAGALPVLLRVIVQSPRHCLILRRAPHAIEHIFTGTAEWHQHGAGALATPARPPAGSCHRGRPRYRQCCSHARPARHRCRAGSPGATS